MNKVFLKHCVVFFDTCILINSLMKMQARATMSPRLKAESVCEAEDKNVLRLR